MSVETLLTLADTIAAAPAEAGQDRSVLVIYGGQGAAANTRVVELPEDAQLTIGRSRSAGIHVDSERISRIHAKIARRNSQISVEDCGSRNGTWVNGERVDDTRRLFSGDEVTVGPATIVLSITSRVMARTRIGSSLYLEERLAAEIDRGKRYRRPCSLVMLRVDGNPVDADAAIDRVSARLRPMDVLAEYSPAVLSVVVPEIDVTKGVELARSLASEARYDRRRLIPSLVVSVGVASFPDHATTAGELVSRALKALESVRGNRSEASVGVPVEPPAASSDGIIVEDPQMRRVFELARKVADHAITVLVHGETGVGKEVVAGAIHSASSRRDGPFVRLNCASLPETLLESELFGHEKGAFTGADRRKQGYFEAAHGGTLFLDEIGEVSAGIQAKLLRVLEDHIFTRVGGTKEIEVDVRVVCATNRDLEQAVNAGEFRADLFFRISAFTILVPPLRDRPGEILPLAQDFVRRCATETHVAAPELSEGARSALKRYHWPGNVRELRNALERAVVLHSGDEIDVDDLPDRVRDVVVPATVSGAAIPLDGQRDVRDHMAQLERAAIVAALEACGGSQTKAAKKLGVSRRALIYRMEKHGLKPPPRGTRR